MKCQIHISLSRRELKKLQALQRECAVACFFGGGGGWSINIYADVQKSFQSSW